jgi:hypothetical protein
MNDSTRDSTVEEQDYPRLLARRSLSVCIPGLTARLRSLSIHVVRMEYAGANGQGDFIHVEFRRADGTQLSASDPAVHSTALQAILRYVLASRHPNWNERDGSTGDFRWDLAADSLTHTHYVRGAHGNERVVHYDLDG